MNIIIAQLDGKVVYKLEDENNPEFVDKNVYCLTIEEALEFKEYDEKEEKFIEYGNSLGLTKKEVKDLLAKERFFSRIPSEYRKTIVFKEVNFGVNPDGKDIIKKRSEAAAHFYYHIKQLISHDEEYSRPMVEILQPFLNEATEDNWPKIIAQIKDLGKDFEILAMYLLMKKNPEFDKKHKEFFLQWAKSNNNLF